jgi:hypothetical protein
MFYKTSVANLIYFINNYAIAHNEDFVTDVISLNLLTFDTNSNNILFHLKKQKLHLRYFK